MSAPAVRAATSNHSIAGSATIAVAKPAGTVAGDLILICAFHHRFGLATGILSCPGFTVLESDINAPFTFNGSSAVLARIADGSEGATFTVTDAAGADPSNGWVIFCLSISGPDATLPAIHTKAWSTANDQLIKTASVTTTTTDSLDVRFGIKQRTGTGMSVPAGYTNRGSDVEANANTFIHCATKTQAAAGAYGTADFTTTEAANTSRDGGYTIAVLSPASALSTTAPFISAGTTLYTPGYTLLKTETVPFIAAGTTVYQPSGLSEHLAVPFISSSTSLFTPGYTLNFNDAVPFIAAATSVHAPTLANSGIDRFLGQSAAMSV